MGNKSQRLTKSARNAVRSARKSARKDSNVETVKYLGAVKSATFRSK